MSQHMVSINESYSMRQVASTGICNEMTFLSLPGTICGNSIEREDLQVICHQFGLEAGSQLQDVIPGTDPIWVDDLLCEGDEVTLEGCEQREWGDHNCDHTMDLGVRCYLLEDNVCGEEAEGSIRLVGGQSNMEGRLEICHNSYWGNYEHYNNPLP